jgi:hypothetical protein
MPGDRAFYVDMLSKTPEIFKQFNIKTNPLDVRQGGLDDIQAGFDEMKVGLFLVACAARVCQSGGLTGTGWQGLGKEVGLQGRGLRVRVRVRVWVMGEVIQCSHDEMHVNERRHDSRAQAFTR